MPPDAPPDPAAAPPAPDEEIAVLAGGCFWCTEAVFSELEGVRSVRPGYTGGHAPNPTYEEVCTGATGHAEAIEIRFDPSRISYRDLLVVFFATHDPTSVNRQGNDVGTQYRSAIFVRDDRQRATAEALVRELAAARTFRRPIVTEIVPAGPFYPAEEYHRDYYRRNPEKGYCQLVIAPKMAKFRARFSERLARER
ncbi:MAG: peptide-methionine (S)-S-oxide reductase MsrA [Thermoplasmata archaeon]